MSQVQPWIAVAGVVAGMGMGIAAASWHWAKRLTLVQRSVDHLSASRNLLDQQNTQARRQVEQLQAELAELRVFADRARRKLASLMPAPGAAAVAAPTPVAPAAPPRPTAQQVAQMLNQNDQRRDQQHALAHHGDDDAGFEPTQVDPPDQL
ncbi:hypothetical protein SAMN05216359_11196 [Roseateles sp. YR242]|uniref:hypothetical protein n=1 Tax=Roseateles sp. YR242 TaxID=1855305 RepID=UPI0008AB2861|nr:hypothetical protein [Roseateles sp. YR242]SEL57207.1 hypothetical protein SAMN05216359_11196 [Roseateles sp. YR242]